MNNLCNGCKWYYYVRGWDFEHPNATCRHERDNPESTQPSVKDEEKE